MTLLGTVLTSAVVSAIVSSLLTLLGQYLERKSREKVARLERESREEDQRLEREKQRKELLLSKAIELALTRTELVKDLAIASKVKATFKDSLLLANSYYKDLQLLIDTGDISEETKKRYADSKKRMEAKAAEEVQ